ncbi:hypothetical protein PVK06_042031 [Gossypium arboreum]|uniref:Nucleoplasmin-like domain-containing protein n=1 Tax=Gossypium arboreum TaxID=29729 RepID=A0ABR0NC35_GOSAR|nr:hypothetical protein PVK06_042031 [Gossypium arboreum]
MEFWGAEVKSGQSFEVELEDDGSRILHISQAALGEVTSDNKKEKGNGTACIYLKFNNEKFVIGTLSHDKFPQMPLDLALHSKFELSHTWKNGSVYFTGYYVDTPQGSGSESEEELLEPIVNPVKPHSTASDPTTSEQIKIVEPKKAEDSSDDEDEDDTSTEDEMSSEDQEPGMLVNGENESNNDTDSDEDDSEEESSDEDPETPEMEKGLQLSLYFLILITGDWFSLGRTEQEEICRVSYKDPCTRKEGKASHSPKDRWQESGWTYSNSSSFKASQKGIDYYRSSESKSKARRFIIPLQVLRQLYTMIILSIYTQTKPIDLRLSGNHLPLYIYTQTKPIDLSLSSSHLFTLSSLTCGFGGEALLDQKNQKKRNPALSLDRFRRRRRRLRRRGCGYSGAEVKSGQSFEVELEDDGSRILHISQAALGEVTSDNKKEKGNGTACIYLKFNNEKFVIGTLSHDKFPQMPLDLALHSEFELSHTWKNGSVYFTGYYVDTPQGSGSESEEELLEPIVNPVKSHSTASDPTTSKQVKIVEPKKAEDSSDDEDEDDTSTEDEMSSEDQEFNLVCATMEDHRCHAPPPHRWFTDQNQV